MHQAQRPPDVIRGDPRSEIYLLFHQEIPCNPHIATVKTDLAASVALPDVKAGLGKSYYCFKSMDLNRSKICNNWCLSLEDQYAV